MAGDSVTPVIKTNNMTYEGYINYSDLTMRHIEKSKLEKGYLLKGDLLIEKSGGTKYHSVGYVNFFDGENDKYVCNNFVLALRPNATIIRPKYLFHQLKYKYESGKFADCYNKTTGIQNLQVKTYLSKGVLIPSFGEQDRVIKTLDDITTNIHVKQNQLNKLDSLVKSRFSEMFMQGQCDIYPLKKWSEVATIKHGKDYKKNITKKGGYPVFGSGGFMGVFANGFITKKNSTLIGRKGTLDKPIFVKENVWNVDTAFGVEPDEDIVNSTFFFYRSCLYDYKSLSTSTTLPSMTKSTLESLSIGIPSMELQKNFASFVNLIDKSRFIVQSQIKDLQELLDSKMDEYFGGDNE